MAEYPYTVNPAKVGSFFSKIQSISKPEKITQKFLVSIGFKSNSDRSFPSILRFVGFTDSSNIPTERWQAYRDKDRAPIVLAEAIRESYSSLFSLYSDAYRKDDEALTNFFSANTTVGARAVEYIVKTFKELCEMAEFKELDKSIKMDAKKNEDNIIGTENKIEGDIIGRTETMPSGVTVNINIQLTLPETKDSSIYDKIFESLRNNLMRH